MGKFSSVDEAARHVDGQLTLKGFLAAGQSLQLEHCPDAKLVINTVHKLLTSIEEKSRQVDVLHATVDDLKRTPKVVEVVEVPRVETRQVRVAKPKADHKRIQQTVTKVFQVKLNQLQCTIDELRYQLNSERNRSRRSVEPDITWKVEESIAKLPSDMPTTREIISKYQAEVTDLRIELEGALRKKQMICKHLDTVNRYTYSWGVLDITPVEVKPTGVQEQEWSDWLNGLKDNDLELNELIQDWYEIVTIAKSQRATNDDADSDGDAKAVPSGDGD
ncbi:(ZYRO0D14828g) [Zygosaccharomyces parabailii]|uniref:BN860_04126g1_1 n=1 Tax=Zygosaccharomyces bailii (strain CLIB 213 / ATCC 58445 / CBS 680 / BCRC 21525 / NBRC 1098 / NCYC 1416 / NRRL Y-2227) TaxID=1333698 RepID=A0A8J2T2D8_ZYGB2|nr:(ZYRO0D14828g) [Zygosaccharomyces parabailii]CDF88180.1 BN860_04126g1_1 [Zygosaccharomyces bailii CLIB 213]CDH14923.1 uncharacterized protein ZBAI_06709 [Zygosaccharomyces bailii ISA1307]SJM81648.1 uncharacterized protein ZBIST_0042 [Zygosaccharomyces bailii]